MSHSRALAAPRPAQLRRRRGWMIAMEVKEVGRGASVRELRQKLLDAARHRDSSPRSVTSAGIKERLSISFIPDQFSVGFST
jgi:hypothetical protein